MNLKGRIPLYVVKVIISFSVTNIQIDSKYLFDQLPSVGDDE